MCKVTSNHCADYTVCRTADCIGFTFGGTGRTMDCDVLVAVAIGTSVSVKSSSGCSADNGVRDYGFRRTAECAQISCGCGLQDYGLF